MSSSRQLTTSRGDGIDPDLRKGDYRDYCPTLTNRRIKLAGAEGDDCAQGQDPPPDLRWGGIDYGDEWVLQVEKIRCVKATLVEDSLSLPASCSCQLFLRGITESLTRLDCESFVARACRSGFDSWRERLQLTLLKFEAFSALMPFRAGMYRAAVLADSVHMPSAVAMSSCFLRNECRREQTFTLMCVERFARLQLRRLYNVDQVPDCPRPRVGGSKHRRNRRLASCLSSAPKGWKQRVRR